MGFPRTSTQLYTVAPRIPVPAVVFTAISSTLRYRIRTSSRGTTRLNSSPQFLAAGVAQGWGVDNFEGVATGVARENL